MDDDVKASRLAYISRILDAQGLKGNPRRFIVLHSWNRIRDHDAEYQLVLPGLDTVNIGDRIWVTERIDSTDLTEAKVMQRHLDGFWVAAADRDVQFLAPFHACHVTPIPHQPLAVRRRDLWQWVGLEYALRWHGRRQARLAGANDKTQVQDGS